MKYWPVPKSYNKKIPKPSAPGSFWENRVDRHHCGIDIYAPKQSKIISILDGKIIKTGKFTSANKIKYWNTTYYIDIQNTGKNIILRYAELFKINKEKDEYVSAGETIGLIGQVLNKSKINKSSPLYIQKLKNKDKLSMLHFEMYKSKPDLNKKYLGGNWFGKNIPQNLLDPTVLLKSL